MRARTVAALVGVLAAGGLAGAVVAVAPGDRHAVLARTAPRLPVVLDPRAIEHDAMILQRGLGTGFRIEPYGQGYLTTGQERLVDGYTASAEIFAAVMDPAAGLCQHPEPDPVHGDCKIRRLPTGQAVEVRWVPAEPDAVPDDAGVQTVAVTYQRSDGVSTTVGLGAVAVRDSVTRPRQTAVGDWLTSWLDRLGAIVTDPGVEPLQDSRRPAAGAPIVAAAGAPPLAIPPRSTRRVHPGQRGMENNAAILQAALGPDFTIPNGTENAQLKPGSPAAAGLPSGVGVNVQLAPANADNGDSLIDECRTPRSAKFDYCVAHLLPDHQIVQVQGLGTAFTRMLFMQPGQVLVQLDLIVRQPRPVRPTPGTVQHPPGQLSAADLAQVQRWERPWLDRLGAVATNPNLDTWGLTVRGIGNTEVPGPKPDLVATAADDALLRAALGPDFVQGQFRPGSSSVAGLPKAFTATAYLSTTETALPPGFADRCAASTDKGGAHEACVPHRLPSGPTVQVRWGREPADPTVRGSDSGAGIEVLYQRPDGMIATVELRAAQDRSRISSADYSAVRAWLTSWLDRLGAVATDPKLQPEQN